MQTGIYYTHYGKKVITFGIRYKTRLITINTHVIYTV